jgi:hypothetical protein
MVPELRNDFNQRYTPEHYRVLLSRLAETARARIDFRVAETPCFFPQSLLDTVAQAGSSPPPPFRNAFACRRIPHVPIS